MKDRSVQVVLLNSKYIMYIIYGISSNNNNHNHNNHNVVHVYMYICMYIE